MDASLVFPHQLFSDSPVIGNARKVFIYEDPLFFTQFSFHKKKLVLHRASMKQYEALLEQRGVDHQYLGIKEFPNTEAVFEYLRDQGVEKLHCIYPDDYLLERRLKRSSRKQKIQLVIHENPDFLLDGDGLNETLGESDSYFMAAFYKKQRRSTGLLMDDGKPAGGKWSFDEENRKKLPKEIKIPELYRPRQNEYVKEAIDWVEEHFPSNPGETEGFNYPVNYYQAEKWLNDFLEHRIDLFGDYEDALSDKDPFLFHSVLTPTLNIGLLTPDQVIDAAMERHARNPIPLNSLEGFIRQIIGWREFMRGVYFFKGTFQRTNNYFNHRRPLPKSFWTGETGIPPIDDVIKKVLDHAYAHHIERLMILGNFMLLCEYDPDDIYRWFMEMFIDAYDWVMVPNVYGMTQYADNGLITTKPYISGSNYIRKMSHYKTGEWAKIWDGLYWRFLHAHQEEFRENQRMNMVMSLLDRMDKQKLDDHLRIANDYLDSL